ncbi:MAG TPA: hypothetical protein VF796_21195 [Humisphaera sp.]
MSRRPARALLLALALSVPAASAALAADAPPSRPSTAPAADHLAVLRALKPNHAALLGKASVVGDFNDTARQWELDKTGPQGRDYSIKMVWAPDRRRALFCGANHGVPHRLNDVWEFDLATLTWHLLYAPDHNRDYTGLGKDPSDVLFKDGVLITKRGGPAVIGHTWWGLTYDPQAKALLFMNTWVTDQKKAVFFLDGDVDQLYKGPPLWAFYPAEGRWEFQRTDKPYPTAPFGGMLEHLPELGGTVWHVNNWQMQQTWLFDATKKAWRPMNPNGGGKAFEQAAPQPEQVGYHDPKRKLLVVQRQADTFHYNVTKNEWKKVIAREKGAADVPHGHDATSVFHHDPASGHGLLLEYKTNALWAYDPDAADPTAAWKKLTPEGDPMPDGSKRLAYVDQALNAFVVIKGTTVWAYRYR